MTENKPEWYQIAKGSLEEDSFTEQMKHEVIQRIHERLPRREKFGFRAAAFTMAVAIVTISIVILFLLFPAFNDDRAPSPAGSETPSVESIPQTEPPITSPQKEVQLDYRDIEEAVGEYPVENSRIEAVRIPRSSIFVKRIIDLGEQGNFLIYLKKEGDTQLYSGMEIVTAGPGSAPTTDIYELGTAGALQYLDDAAITVSHLFGELHIRIYGVCGSDCVTNNWIHFEEAAPGLPISDFRLNANVLEIDVNTDGTMDAVIQPTSMNSQIAVIKKINEKIKIADLNIALTTEFTNSITFDNEKLIFKAIYRDRILSYKYQKNEEALILIEDSQATADQNQRPH